jgi:hypothetical protein
MEKILIPRQNIEKLKKKFNLAIKKAKKFGMEVPELLIYKDESIVKRIEVDTYNGVEKYDIVHVPVSYSGMFPIIKGWNLTSIIEHSRVETEKIFNKVRVAPNFEEKVDREKLVSLPPNCDHCNSKRFRKKTYILENSETGEIRQVGSTCVKDFLGDEDPTHIVNSAKWIDFVENMINGFGFVDGSPKREYKVEDVLTVTDAVIKKYGWVSRGDSLQIGEESTSEKVNKIILSSELMKDLDITEKNKEFAKKAIEWIKSLDMSDKSLSEYLFNCGVCVGREYIEEYEFGIVCSIISSYKNKLDKEESLKNEQKSDWFGKVKERIKDIPVTFVNQYGFPSTYGYVYFFKFITEKGNVVIWKTSKVGDWEYGDKLFLTGTVKDHTTYNDVKQTIMTRCKVN